MCEPVSLGTILASVGSAFKFADLAVRIAEVGSESEVFVRTIHIVRDDLNEVHRLLNAETVQRKLASTPTKLPWVSNAINNTSSALDEIGTWVERARPEQQSAGSVEFNTVARWAFSDHEKLSNRKTELLACHQQLSNVLSYLIHLEDTPTTNEPPTYQDTTYFEDILRRHRRKATWKAPPIALADTGQSNANDVSKTIHPRDLAHFDTEATQPFIVNRQYHSRAASSVFRRTIMTPESPLPLSSQILPPCSPLPAHASTVQSGPQISKINEQYGIAKNGTRADYTSAASYTGSKALLPVQSGPQGTWAYQLIPDDTVVQELAGDSVSFSAYSYGPVNPFDYGTGPQPSLPKFSHTINKTKDVAELLGDLNFAVELPNKDPGPPLGYPPWSSKGTVRDSASESVNQAHISRPKMSVSELPGMPIRRPVPWHARSEPVSTAYGLPPTSLHPISIKSLSEHNSILDGNVSTLEQVQQSKPRPSSSIGFQTPYQFPNSTASLNSLSTREARISGKLPYQQSAAFSHTAARPNSVDERLTSSSSQETTESTTYSRMRRQKQMMDMLGSIESSSWR